MSEAVNKTAPAVGAEQVALLERLCNAAGVSGDEREVRAIILEQVKGLADEVRVDSLGSVLAVKHARVENPLRVMLDAHMDEVGFMIVSDEESGLYRFVKVGGIDDRSLPGKPVLVGKDNIPGVIGAKPIHLTEPGETANKISVDSLRIDVGPGGGRIRPGDRAVFATRFREVGPSFIAKALDNRLGCVTLIEILRAADQLPEHIELLLSWSVQEEIGLRGARTAAYSLNPDLAIAVDATPAYDLPAFDEGEDGALENARYNTRLGYGPAIYLADSHTLGDPRIARHIMKTGDELGIPYQVRQPGGGGTDAGAIHLARAGVPVLSISTPGRYMHTAASLVRRSDWENTLRLVWNGLLRMERGIVQSERR
ncbi:MAG: M42 family metallopeptidase [Chloroflexi bacterium]|nr:M42 family metallopeptidase [Chloroflexota bacterium]